MQKIPGILSFLSPYLRQNKPYLWIFFITVIIAGFESSLQAYFMKWIINLVSITPKATLLPHIIIPAVLYVSMDLYHNLTMRAYLYAAMKMYPVVKTQIIDDLFHYISKHSIQFFQSNLAGDIASKIQDISIGTEPLIRSFFDGFIARLATPIIVTFFLATVSWWFSLIFVVWTILFVLITFKLSKGVGKSAECFARNKNQMSGKLIDAISNIITAKIFGQTQFEKEHLGLSLAPLKDSEQQVQWDLLKLHFFQGLMTFSLLASFMGLLIYGRIYGNLTPGDFAFILTLLIMSLSHIYILGQTIGDAIKGIGEFRQALNVLLLPHDLVDHPNAKPLILSKGIIELKDIDFEYNPDQLLFKDFNLRIESEEKVGIVGSSGAGKSTLIHLLLRLFEPSAGKITIDGQNIDSVTINSLLKAITLVPQQVDLFHRSILDNIRYGYLEATEEEIYHAATLAECDEFIQQLPQGYLTQVGERGMKLSGGQKQRIAIARAYLKPAKILIMDEATSALDSITESYIQKSLMRIMQNKTTIIVAHRLATLKQMDRIVVLEKGKIVEQGPFQNLIQSNGPFSQMWKQQAFI
ncbi:ABC transporter ATP-binding protein [Legionella wadsworthii]|uniref:ABC transporter ATP-binding protein n=1 Tax=Legionella wadsworthii TaxID=28088 RepID=A0A378LUZ7_9GAMM|nr:ABC transporter ATP-binding protein [Legionella wadsworthii]STY29662.1 ABC transporter ATP-binding protein [Legionella wadsworthii]